MNQGSTHKLKNEVPQAPECCEKVERKMIFYIAAPMFILNIKNAKQSQFPAFSIKKQRSPEKQTQFKPIISSVDLCTSLWQEKQNKANLNKCLIRSGCKKRNEPKIVLLMFLDSCVHGSLYKRTQIENGRNNYNF